MKIQFDDGGYLEFQRSRNPNKVWVMVAVRSQDNPLELRVNSAEVEVQGLISAVQSVTGPVILKRKDNNEEYEAGNQEAQSQADH